MDWLYWRGRRMRVADARSDGREVGTHDLWDPVMEQWHKGIPGEECTLDPPLAATDRPDEAEKLVEKKKPRGPYQRHVVLGRARALHRADPDIGFRKLMDIVGAELDPLITGSWCQHRRNPKQITRADVDPMWPRSSRGE